MTLKPKTATKHVCRLEGRWSPNGGWNQLADAPLFKLTRNEVSWLNSTMRADQRIVIVNDPLNKPKT